MKKIISAFLLSIFLFFNASFAKAEQLPELPNLPAEVEFDTVIPPDNLDVFAPSATPSETVSTPPQTTVQKSSTIKVTPVKSGSSNTTVSKPPQQVIQQPQTKQTANNTTTSPQGTYRVVKKGKKFKVKLAQSVSSNTPTGTKVSFKSLYPETSTYVTIPAGTTFYGQVTESHAPQYTGNGGLIVIDVSQMVYRGRTYQIDAKVSLANNKRIFLNNIKGQRMYLRNFPKAMKTGTKYFNKMWRVTKRLFKNESGVEIILTPFSLGAGTVVYVANAIVSPVLAIFYKGKSITIPAESNFTIQLRKDIELN